MKFSDLFTKIDNATKTVSVTPDFSFTVLQYLPIEEKYDLIYLAIQESEEQGFYSPIKLEMYFYLYLIYSYTNLEFTDEEKNNPSEIFDILQSQGILEAIVNCIPDKEYATLLDLKEQTLAKKEKYRNSVAGVLNSFVENLAPNAETAAKIIENFKPENFEKVIQFARAANGGRAIE